MQDTITTMFCLCDDFLKANGCYDDRQCRVSTAQIMMTPLVACAFFGGNLALSRRFLVSHGYFQRDLSASRFCRRLHAINRELWRNLFRLLGEVFVRCNSTASYVVDSLPIPACDNIRIKHCQLLAGDDKESYRGCIASKRRFFFGFKVHLLVTGKGEPIEFVILPGSCADITAFKSFDLDLPSGSLIHADRAYNDYSEEDLLLEAAGITLQPQRKKNSKRPLALCKEFLFKPVRQCIETAFSQITNLFPKHIHAVTAEGFVLKVVCFLLAYSLHCLQA
jgi:hypothetical protein